MENEKQITSDIRHIILSEWENIVKPFKKRKIIIIERSIWRSPISRGVKDSSGVRFTPL